MPPQKTEDELDDIADAVLTRIYEETIPPMDFMAFKKDPDREIEIGFYRRYYLPKKRQMIILETVCKERGCTSVEIMRIKMKVMCWAPAG